MTELNSIRRANARSIAIVIGMFGLSLGVLLNNYSLMNKRTQESEAERDRMRRIAGTDPLTGVKSKHAYVHIESELNSRIAAGELKSLAVVVCDVNGLKFINDSQGHQAGDAYIQSACKLICERFQHSPVYRVGGDEFAVLLSGSDYDSRDLIIAELNRRIEENLKHDQVVVAAGMSEFIPGEDDTIRAVFERADALMYQRKKHLKSLGAHTR